MRKQEYLDHPFVTRQLISYIGNKRRLLGFLSSVFTSLERSSGPTRFLDPFAGSGSVSRLAKLRGYSVAACDIEDYSAILCRAALSFAPDNADELLREWGGYAGAVSELNVIGRSAAADTRRTPGYIEHNYAPESTEHADYRTERLFYTTENAAFIDAVRDTIDRWFPPADPGDHRSRHEAVEAARTLLIAPLLVEASVHANTSGVFKAYHKGFGGHGRDALSRILAPAELEPVPLIDGPRGEVAACEAAEFCRRHPADIAYLDPPYNQHQYGSNYFMLNTIARWDKPDVPARRKSDGSLREKAGIRSDWRETRSDFCRRDSAVRAFATLLDAIDASTIVLSYNTEGIVPFEQLYELLSSHGEVQVQSFDYVQFRGGRQSATRSNRTAEMALVVRRRNPVVAGGEASQARAGDGRTSPGFHIARSFRVASFARQTFVPDRVRERFGSPDAVIRLDACAASDNAHSRVQSDIATDSGNPRFEAGIRLSGLPPASELRKLETGELERLEDDLAHAACRDNIEEIDVLLSVLDSPDASQYELFSEPSPDFHKSGPSRVPGDFQEPGDSHEPDFPRAPRGPQGPRERRRYEQRVLQLLRKLAHPRYVDALLPRYDRFTDDENRVTRNRKALEALRSSTLARCNISLELSSSENTGTPDEGGTAEGRGTADDSGTEA